MSPEEKENVRLRNELAEKIFLIHYKAYIDQEANKCPVDEVVDQIPNALIFRMIENAIHLARGVRIHLTGGVSDPADDPFL